jgi:hypothetical protein
MIATAIKRRFKPVRRLGEGTTGVVYEVVDVEHGTRVALKTLRHMTPESLARLKREFRAMQDVHHHNLVSLGELVSEGDEWFFTMELIDGVEWLAHVRDRFSSEQRDPPMGSIPPQGSIAPASAVTPRSHVADTPAFDEARLRNALRQLAEGLCALHTAGLVHRDVKSSNVRVTREGRVVLLDFGLVDNAGNSNAWTQHAAGTPAYMAPEQVTSAQVRPAADWYALGVLLFEALTGRLPFEGSALEVMMRKQKERAPAPSTLVNGLPEDLDALCTGLLSFDPAARPRDSELLRVLGATSDSASATGSHTHTTAFVGRASELESLMAAFHEARGGSAVTVVVEGDSGVGKSALVRRFAQRLSAEWPEAIVLAGRCYERESVPFKAFDGVVDALARVLIRMGEDGANLVPTRVAPIVQVFPVLRRVAAIAEQTLGRQAEIRPFDLREQAFASLRELFTRLADRRPLVVIIDDAQWSDLDSLELLTELLRPPEAPSLMLVLPVRTGIGLAQNHADLRGRALADTLLGKVRRIQVGPLPEEDAALLATQLLARSGVNNPELASWSVRQTGGHPLFIDMLMRRADVASSGAGAELRLEDVLWAIIEKLDEAPRVVLETVAVAAAPLAQDVVRRATALSAEFFLKAVSLLRVSHLVQTSGARDADRLEPYHDRVRGAVLAHLEDGQRAECHRRIAIALETSGQQDAEALYVHWQGAGDAQRAAHYAALAGDHAAEALAFDQAAAFYEVALAKGDAPSSERRTLLVKLAKVLESAGHGEGAAYAYLQAAEGAPALQRAELERAASVELLSSGRLAEGTTVLHRVLAAVGFRAPRTPLGALFWLLIYRVWLAARGLRFKERSPDEVRREDRARIDALFAAAMGFAVSDTILAVCLNLRHLISALRAGDRFQVLRATCLHMAALAAAGGTPSKLERALSAIAVRLTEREESADGRAYFDGCHGVALYLRGRWKDAVNTLDGSLSKQQTHSHRAGWQSNSHVFGCWALRYLGEHAELARRHARLLVDAYRRGDLYTSVQLRDGSLAVVWLADDNPEEARRHAQEAMTQWPRTRYLTQHWHMMSGEAEIELYVGNAVGAYARVEQDKAALKRSLIGKVQHLRALTAFIRGRCAVAIAGTEPALQKARLSEARKLARRIDKEKMAWTLPLAAMLRAGVASVQGDREGAAAALGIAIESAEAADMHGHAHAARYQLGLLIGGSQGESLVRQANDAMTAEGIRAPGRFAQMLVPGNWEGKRTSEGTPAKSKPT